MVNNNHNNNNAFKSRRYVIQARYDTIRYDSVYLTCSN